MRTRIAQITTAVLGLLVMAEALFWPIINKPETLEWWQYVHLAQIGRYVGVPVWGIL